MPSPNTGLMLGHRLRRWPNINPVLSERLVFDCDVSPAAHTGNISPSSALRQDAQPAKHISPD